MNLGLDIGNTNVKLGLFSQNKMIDYVFTRTFSIDFLESFLITHSGVKNLCFSNTSSELVGLHTFCKKKNITLIKVDSECVLPIEIKYTTPNSLGSDRIALAVGAYMKYKGEKLVIDIGTCLTYDLIVDNKYIGGQVSPGLNMRLSALNVFTKKLPKIPFKRISDFIGKTTENSILSGVYNGVESEIIGIIEKYRSYYPNLIVILTGGDVNVFETSMKNISFINPYLLMEGLNHIIASNEKN